VLAAVVLYFYLPRKLTRLTDTESQSSIKKLIEKLQDTLSTSTGELNLQLQRLRKEDQASTVTAVAELFEQLQSNMRNAGKTRCILASFEFETLHAREEDVKEKHAQTFGWIYSDKSPFARWLRQDSSLFWISGKAGSGKSTLMKYIFESSETRTGLETWAGRDEVALSRHFFWRSGTTMQKSSRGLLQALCYDVFKACPDLIPYACPRLWASTDASECLNPIHSKTKTWSEAEMLDLIRKFVSTNIRTSEKNVRLCFFIDGLDEYHGEYQDLIDAIFTLSQMQNVKLCVSSRPWNVFRAAFDDLSTTDQTITLQDLTQDDIKSYAEDRLGKNKSYSKMVAEEPRYSHLVSEITSKADGVFLWVYLVINELLKSLVNYDDFETLQRRLERIPRGLEAYFRYMFDNLDEFYKFETARIFKAIVVARFEVQVLALSTIFSTEPLALRVLNFAERPLGANDQLRLYRMLSTRMIGCCGDLLEVKRNKVEFLHRTVKDFLSTEEVTAELDRRVGKFSVDIAMCEMALIGFRYRDSGVHFNKSYGTTDFVVAFCVHARNLELEYGRPPTSLHDGFRGNQQYGGYLGETRLLLLSGMHLALELKRAISEVGTSAHKDNMTRYARMALTYLLQARPKSPGLSGGNRVNTTGSWSRFVPSMAIDTSLNAREQGLLEPP
jgi:hypothetical protein